VSDGTNYCSSHNAPPHPMLVREGGRCATGKMFFYFLRSYLKLKTHLKVFSPKVHLHNGYGSSIVAFIA